MAAVDLEPDYYWRNLRTVVETVRASNAALFVGGDDAVFDRWAALPVPAQLLLSRMLMRRGPDFRRNTLDYAEVGDVEAAIAALAEAGLATDGPDLDPAAHLAAFTVPELKAVGRSLGLSLRGRRADIVGGLLAAPADGVRAALRAHGRVVRRHGDEAFYRARVVFFGNRRQELSTFVLVALDQVRYPPVPVDRAHPLFPDRAALDDYLAAGARRDAVFEARMAERDDLVLSLGAAAAEDLRTRPLVPSFRARVDPARADARVVYHAARTQERLGAMDAARAGYRLLLETRRHLGTAARAADRLGLVQRRAGDVTGLAGEVAPLLAEPALDAPARRLVRRRLKLAGVGPDPRAEDPRIPVREFTATHVGQQGSKALYAGADGPVTVEEAVLAVLGGDGVWCEGAAVASLFGLLFWDAIFEPVAGAFQHPFQDAPMDFDSGQFFVRREASIRARIAALVALDLGAEVAAAIQRHRGLACRGVRWDPDFEALLVRAAGDLGPARLLPVLERYAKNPGRHRSGLPDLLVWVDGEVTFVEVKGPGDQPSGEQRLWHAWLVRHAVPFFIARVRRD